MMAFTGRDGNPRPSETIGSSTPLLRVTVAPNLDDDECCTLARLGTVRRATVIATSTIATSSGWPAALSGGRAAALSTIAK